MPAGARNRDTARGALLGFFVDLLIAAVVMLAASLFGGVVWGVVRAMQLGLEGAAELHDADAVMAAIGQPDGLAMLWMTLFSTGAAALVPYYLRRRAMQAERAASGIAARRPGTWAWVALIAAAVFLLSNGLTALAHYAGIAPQPSNLAPIEEAMAASPGFVVLFVVLIAPAYEELLFRRVLFGRLWAAGRPWLGMALSGAVFACLHEMPGFSANSASATALLWLTYGLMGVAFAWLYRRTGTLWAPIGAHALNNALALLALQLSAGPG